MRSRLMQECFCCFARNSTTLKHFNVFLSFFLCRRQIKNRSDSTVESEKTPDTLSRHSSTKSNRGQPGTVITPIDEGYESIILPSRPNKAPETSVQDSSYDFVSPPRQPVSPASDSPSKCPLSVPASFQSPPARPPKPGEFSPHNIDPQTTQVAPYDMVDITKTSSQSSLTSESGSPSRQQGTSAIYQQPTSMKEARFDTYDNVNIKNIPAAPPTVPSSEYSPSKQLGLSNEDGVSTGHEIDAGGMGCGNIEEAVKERKDFYKEVVDQEGVVLLEKKEETSNDGKGLVSCVPPLFTVFPFLPYLLVRSFVRSFPPSPSFPLSPPFSLSSFLPFIPFPPPPYLPPFHPSLLSSFFASVFGGFLASLL